MLIALVASLISTIIEGSLWYRNSSSQVAVNTYWSDGVAAKDLMGVLNGGKFTVSQGEFTSDYAFFIRLSEIGLTSKKNQCVNCVVTSRGVDVLPNAKKLAPVTYHIVIFGNCPRDFQLTKSIGAYSICKRI
jgi:hypothetical protein